MKNNEIAKQWLRRSKSNLVFAKADLFSSGALYEDLCFNAQQAAEKALKALCASCDIVFPKTHDLVYLIEILEKANVNIPEELQSVKLLTEYAVEIRYPGEYEPVLESEYKFAVDIAEKLVAWIEKELEEK